MIILGFFQNIIIHFFNFLYNNKKNFEMMILIIIYFFNTLLQSSF